MSENNVDEWIFVKPKCGKQVVSSKSRPKSVNKPLISKYSSIQCSEILSVHDSLNSIRLLYDSMKDTILISVSKLFIQSNLLSSFERVQEKLSTQVCLMMVGIGSMSSSTTSRLQFAYALHIQAMLKAILHVDTTTRENDLFSSSIFDPLLNDIDATICKDSNIQVDAENCKGKFQVREDTVYIYFMPHCPYQLYNNVLWSHWRSLHNIFIIGNSFSAYELRRLDAEVKLADTMTILSRATEDIMVETNISKNLTYPQQHASILRGFEHAFNDTSIHSFRDMTSLSAITIEYLDRNYASSEEIDIATNADEEIW